MVENCAKYLALDTELLSFSLKNSSSLIQSHYIYISLRDNFNFLNKNNYRKFDRQISYLLDHLEATSMKCLNEYFMFIIKNNLDANSSFHLYELILMTYMETGKFSPAIPIYLDCYNPLGKYLLISDKNLDQLDSESYFENKVKRLFSNCFKDLRKRIVKNIPERKYRIAFEFNRFESYPINPNADRLYMFKRFIEYVDPIQLRKMKVKFIGEGGIDAGGLRREAMTMIGEEIKNELFTIDSDGYYKLSTTDGLFQTFIGVYIAFCLNIKAPFSINLPDDVKNYIISDMKGHEEYESVRVDFQTAIPLNNLSNVRSLAIRRLVVFGNSKQIINPADIINLLDGSSKRIRVFSEAIRLLNPEELPNLLAFITGSPTLDYNTTKISIASISGGDDENERTWPLPIAHTCFKKIDLPPYSDPNILVEKLRAAMSYSKIISDDIDLVDFSLFH